MTMKFLVAIFALSFCMYPAIANSGQPSQAQSDKLHRSYAWLDALADKLPGDMAEQYTRSIDASKRGQHDVTLQGLEALFYTDAERGGQHFGQLFVRYATLVAHLGESKRLAGFFRQLAFDTRTPEAISAYGLMTFGHYAAEFSLEGRRRIDEALLAIPGDPFIMLIRAIERSYNPSNGYKKAMAILNEIERGHVPGNSIIDAATWAEIGKSFVNYRHGHSIMPSLDLVHEVAGKDIPPRGVDTTSKPTADKAAAYAAEEDALENALSDDDPTAPLLAAQYLIKVLSQNDFGRAGIYLEHLAKKFPLDPRVVAMNALVTSLQKTNEKASAGLLLIEESINSAPGNVFPRLAKAFAKYYSPSGGINAAERVLESYSRDAGEIDRMIASQHLALMYLWSGHAQKAARLGVAAGDCTICFSCPGGCG